MRYGINKTPHTSRAFRRILLVCIKTAFHNSVIFVSIPMVFNIFARALAKVPLWMKIMAGLLAVIKCTGKLQRFLQESPSMTVSG